MLAAQHHRALRTIMLADAQATRWQWGGLVVTLFVAAAFTAPTYAFIVAGTQGAGDAELDLAFQSIGGTALGLALVTVVSICMTLIGLFVAERRKTYAQWRLAGARAGSVVGVVWLQVTVAALVASAAGSALAGPLLMWANMPLVSAGAPQIDTGFRWELPLLTIATVVSAAQLGALPNLMRLLRQKPLQALREATVPVAKQSWVAAVFAALLFGSIVAIVIEERKQADGDLAAAVLAAQIIGLMAVVSLKAWLVRGLGLVVRSLGRFVPPLAPWSAVLRVAVANVSRRSAFTSALLVPWIIVGNIFVAQGSMLFVMGGGQIGTTSEVYLLIALMMPSVAPALVGALASLVMMQQRSRADGRTLCRAGAPGSVLRALPLVEAAVYTAMGAAVVLAMTFGGLVAMDAGWGEVLWRTFAVLCAVMFVGTAVVLHAVRR